MCALHHALSAQRAKARARQRTFAPLALTHVVPEPCEDAPFAPPPIDDIFGVEDGEEETGFIAVPPLDDDEEAPFDAPDLEEETQVFVAPAIEAKAAPIEVEPIIRDRPLPAISIYAAWDRPEAEALLHDLKSDSRLKRAKLDIERGGLDRAVSHAQTRSADLYLLDTNLDAPAMLVALDRLREAAPRACIVILGAVNDIGLLRELAARGVSDYIVPPAKAGDVAQTLCALFADTDTTKVIAVIGARGGIGASTIARNVAWSIAERQQQKATLVDLDLSFGLTGNCFGEAPALSAIDVLGADDAEAALETALTQATPCLQILSAPAKTESLEIEPFAFDTLIANVRRSASYVVLDLPHAWEPWVRTALREADEVIVVVGPDLASLRNGDNILKLLRSERDKPSAPLVVVSMSGLPKRPEIPFKDFSDALRVTPILTFAFEPELFVAAENDGRLIYEMMPDAKAALQLDLLASMVSGHDPIATPTPRMKAEAPKAETLPVLDLVTVAPPAPRRMRGKQRTARTGYLALQEPSPRQRSAPGLVRTLAAVVALTMAGVWFVGHRDDALPRTEFPSAFSA